MLLLLLACATPDPTDKPGDTDTAADTDTDVDTDTDTMLPVDEDRDGYPSDEDCNDNNYQVFPGAPEACNGVDDDCDGDADEDFDADGDGQLDAEACAGGTDCDDRDATVGAGLAETPYDGVDQDCDGADLTDVDGDGYAGGDRGLDCDDGDPSIRPNAEDVPKDGIDQDCDGADSLDGDGDGHDDAALGGDDCDDADADVFPGALDTWNDGRDTDCDGDDNALAFLADAPVTITGDSATQDLAGQDVALCDLDGDTLLDLVISAPFGASYAGQIAIFYGDGAASWGPGMLLSDADTLVTSRDQFLGFEVGCADLDGDGYDDLVTGRGEIDYYTYYNTTFELVIWYGDGARFASTLSESSADATLTMTLGVTPDVPTVYGRSFAVADLDDDGAAEVVVVNDAAAALSEADGAFYVLGGGRYAGSLQLADAVRARIEGEGIVAAVPLPDLDGDGVSEVLFGENGYTGADGLWSDTGAPGGDSGGDTAGDTADTAGPAYLGRASVLDGDVLADGAVGGLAYGFWVGSGAIELGFTGAAGDFDGDGLQDVAITALADDLYADTGGAVYLFAPAEGLVAPGGTSDDATAVVRGVTEQGFFGYTLANTGDVDGDGADDLLVGEIYGDATYGRIWLVSGALAVAGGTHPESVALYAWTGEQAEALTGNALAAGDLDGDGATDFVVAAYAYASDGTNANGKIYVLLSGG